MSIPGLLLMLAACGLLLLAHILRAARWGLLFPPTYLMRRFNLLLGLGLTYAFNLILPLRIGELVRIGLVHRRDGIRLSHVAATVFIERTIDLLAVSVILAALLLGGGSGALLSWVTPAAMAATGAFVLVVTWLVRHSTQLRQVVWRSASLFNDRIRVEIADFWWSAAEIVVGRTLLRWRFLASSMVMWALYLAAYYTFSLAVHISPSPVLDAFLNQPFNALLQNISADPHWITTALTALFAVIPIVAILMYGALRDQRTMVYAVDMIRRRGKSGAGNPKAVRKRFEAITTYDYFLASLFSGTNQLVTGFGLEAINDCIIHKFFKGGSDAITALVEVDQRLMIRKFAVGQAGQKLKTQSHWLKQRGNGDLPLVAVVGEHEGAKTYTYDMPLVTPSNDFYDVIHTSPTPHSRQLLQSVIGHMWEFHALTAEPVSSDRVIADYLDVKASRNARAILDFAHDALPGRNFELNSKVFDFTGWDRLLDPSWLAGQVRDRSTADIHGDLTIENIIIAPHHRLGFYIIDPNPENVFDSPLIDWAKLMQSLHLGYETLNQGISCDVTDGVVRLKHVRSQAYADLHMLLETEACNRLGADGLREVYFHEIVNYLRLTTYKIRQSRMRGLGFFACTTILLDRYAERWG